MLTWLSSSHNWGSFSNSLANCYKKELFEEQFFSNPPIFRARINCWNWGHSFEALDIFTIVWQNTQSYWMNSQPWNSFLVPINLQLRLAFSLLKDRNAYFIHKINILFMNFASLQILRATHPYVRGFYLSSRLWVSENCLIWRNCTDFSMPGNFAVEFNIYMLIVYP